LRMIFEDIIKSCYSGNFYREKVLQSSGFYSLRYFLKLLFVVAIIQTAFIANNVNSFFPKFDLSTIIKYAEFFPKDLEIYVTDSRIGINKELPYVITIPMVSNDPQTRDIQGNPVSMQYSLNIVTFLPKSALITTELDSSCRKYHSIILLLEDSMVFCKRETGEYFGGNGPYETPTITNLENLPNLHINQLILMDVLESIVNFGPLQAMFGYRWLILGLIDAVVLLVLYVSLIVSWGWCVFVYSTFCWFGMILLWMLSGIWSDYYVVLQTSLHSITPCMLVWFLQEDLLAFRVVYVFWTLLICMYLRQKPHEE